MELLDDRGAVDAEADRLADHGVVDRCLLELEHPLLGLDGRLLDDLDALGALEGGDEVGGDAVDDVDLAEIAITSSIALSAGDGPADAFRLDDVKGVAVVFAKAEGVRCARSWKYTTDVGSDPAYPDLSARDAQAMRERAGTIEIVSAERVRDELVKLLLSDRPRVGLEILVESGIAAYVLPEVPALKLEVDEHHRHKDVYDHSLIVLEQAMDLEGPEGGPEESVPGPDLVLRLAALLHDVGKPATRRFEDGGGVSFHHHELVGAKLASKRMKAMRFDKDTTKQVARLVELHLRFHGYGSGEWTDSAVRRYVRDAGDQLARLHMLTRADCTTRNKRKADRLRRTYDELEERIHLLEQQEELASIRPDLDGNQIMEILGIGPSRAVGQAYAHLLERRIEEGPLGPDRARAELLAWWEHQEH